MTPNEIARVEAYLRQTFGNRKLSVVPPAKRGAPIEVKLGDEFIGVLHRDDEDGEVSYSLHITIPGRGSSGGRGAEVRKRGGVRHHEPSSSSSMTAASPATW